MNSPGGGTGWATRPVQVLVTLAERLWLSTPPLTTMAAVTKTEKAATFVFLTLLAFAVLGAGLVLLVSAGEEEALLISDIFATALLTALSAVVARRTSAARPAANAIAARDGIWGAMNRRQWLTLMLGLTTVAVLTGTGAAARILSEPSPAAMAHPVTTPSSVMTTEAAPPPSPGPSPTEDSPSPSTTDSATDPSPSDTSGTDGVPSLAPGSITYLDSVNPVNGGYNTTAVSFAGKRYPRSVSMVCEDATSRYIEWNVAGAQTFKTVVGVGDDTSDAFGNIAEMIFYDQDGHQLGKAVDVSVGHPAAVTIPLQGIVHVRVTCSGRNAKTNEQRYFYGALGDPILIN